ncbi:IclR family transcriptional regulator [Pseudopelagicola sp. nBUS_19]|uniref:IclR family transcriptional regulator n=1 Tax=unclassified Pseudopelagicola TaxID=2649563 RepID=UPI003EB88FAD
MGDRKFANTLARGLSVLRAFRASDNGLTRTELVTRTGLAAATITRLTHTLLELGYLSQCGNLLRLGPGTFALSSVANASNSFLDIADAPLQSLADQTKTLLLLSVPDGSSMTVVRTWRPKGVASVWLEPGNRIPTQKSSTGHAFLAALSDVRFEKLENSDGLQDSRLEGREQLTSQGFTFVQGAARYTQSMNAVAHPYHASNLGDPVVFSCGATPEVLSDARIFEEVGPALREFVRNLEQQTGAPRTYEEA